MTGGEPGAELVTSRTFASSPAEVYGAFADPARLAKWWGPHGAATAIHEFDLRPGGRWRLTMSGPWGDLPMEKTFLAVEPSRRVAVLHRQAGHTFTLDMAFEPVGGGTRLTWRARFATPAELAAVRDSFARGNAENLERLASFLEGQERPGLA